MKTEFKKHSDARYSYKQWRETKQMFVLNHETLGIKTKPGEATMSNLNVVIRPKLSKYWKHLKESSDFPTFRESTEASVREQNATLEFKAVLVLLYKNRAIKISSSGDITEEMRNISYAQAKPKEPQSTVPIASGGDALSYLKIN